MSLNTGPAGQQQTEATLVSVSSDGATAGDPDRQTPALLPEILALVAEKLGELGKKKTLLHFMLGSRQCYHLGLPSLVRELSGPNASFSTPKIRAFLEDFMKSNKFSHVRSLSLLPTGYEWKERFAWADPHLALLRHCLPHVERLVLRFFKKDTQVIRQVFQTQSKNLKHLQISLPFVFQLIPPDLCLPPNVTRLDLELDSDMDPADMLVMLNDERRSPSLKEVRFSGSLWPNVINLALYPRLSALIRTLKISGATFQRLNELPPLQLRELTLEDAVALHPDDWIFISSMDTLRSLTLENIPTGHKILTRLPVNLRKLTLRFPQPTLMQESKMALKMALEEAGLDEIELVCRGSPQAYLAEKDLWSSLSRPPKVDVVY